MSTENTPDVSVESNGKQTLVVADYGTVQVVATVDPCAAPSTVEDAVVDAGRELALALNGPTPRTLFTLPESDGTETTRVQEEGVHVW